MSKKQEVLRSYIKKLGIHKTSKLIGIPITELVDKSGIKIDHKLAYDILFDIREELPKKYKGFRILFSSFDGIVYWSNEDNIKLNGNEYTEDYEFVATPFWDGMPIVPVSPGVYRLLNDNHEEVFDYDVGGEQEIYEPQSEFNSVDELKSWLMNSYLPEVYNIITKRLIPMMREEARTFL